MESKESYTYIFIFFYVNCFMFCARRLCGDDESHTCKKSCYLECGPCDYLVERTLSCNHTVSIECHVDPDTYKCEVLVPTKLPCDHVAAKPCHRDPVTFRCPQPCDSQVPCGHACQQKCHIRMDPDHLQVCLCF